MIGKGSGGNCVYKVKSLINKGEYAMKRILIDINEEKENSTYFNEIEVFKRLNHCNLIKYQEYMDRVVDKELSNTLPPWFDITIALAPAS